MNYNDENYYSDLTRYLNSNYGDYDVLQKRFIANYINEKNNAVAKYKSSLLLSTNVLTLISAIVILFVSYLNKNEQSLTVSDIENPLI